MDRAVFGRRVTTKDNHFVITALLYETGRGKEDFLPRVSVGLGKFWAVALFIILFRIASSCIMYAHHIYALFVVSVLMHKT